MIDLSNIYNIYKIILTLFIILFIFIIYWCNKNIKNSSIKILAIWINTLVLFNFINILFTINFYTKNINKVGRKGIPGSLGPRGFRGKSFICSQCGDAGKEKKDIYTTNVNDYGEIVNSDDVKPGKCLFPFFHEGDVHYNCVNTKRKFNEKNDASKKGWCPTSLNINGYYKTYGYCDNDQADKEEENRIRSEKRRQYILNNTGLIDLTVVMGNRSNVKCPSGFKKINYDLNKNSGGKYIYLCKKMGIKGSGISELMSVDSGSNPDLKCDEGFGQIPYNLNTDSGGNDIRLCKRKSNSKYITDIKVQNNPNCPKDYIEVSGNVNSGSGGEAVHICVTKKQSSTKHDCIFKWEKDSHIYAFMGDKYISTEFKSPNIYDKAKVIINKWGKLPSNIDAAFTWGYDRKLYFFKSDKFWLFDDTRLKIAPGYPKFIKDVWKGVPDNIGAVFTWSKDRKTYFFKGKYYYKFNNKTKSVEKGYPRIISQRWEGLPNSIDAVFMEPITGKACFVRGNSYWMLGPDDKVMDGYPKNLDFFIK